MAFPQCSWYKHAEGCNFGEQCSFAHRPVDEQLCKSLKKRRQKYSCSTERDEEFWLCISGRGVAEIIIDFPEELNHDETDPMCRNFLQQYCAMPNVETKTRRSKVCHEDSLQRRPNAPKYEDRSHDETEWQEHWARESGWRLAKKILKEKHEAAFFSPPEKWCLPSPSKN